MLKHILKQPNIEAYIGQICQILNIPGDIAECGVYKGYSTYHYAQCLQKNHSNKTLIGFDSFCGFPSDVKDDVDLNKFSDVDFENVQNLLLEFNNVVLCKGFYKDTLLKFEDNKFACVILDCDLYQSYKECLTFFYPRMNAGGIIILDEYYSIKYPLARVAVDEFMLDKPEKPEMFQKEPNGWERWRIVKK
jgi:hypothetical protein